MKEHRCSRCLISFPLTPEYFNRDRTHKSGFEYACKTCRREQKKMQGKSRYKKDSIKKDVVGGLIYIIKCHNYYKIGVTESELSLKWRITRMQTGNPYKITLEHKIPTNDRLNLESYLHTTYRNKKVRGERFELTDEDIKHIINFDSK